MLNSDTRSTKPMSQVRRLKTAAEIQIDFDGKKVDRQMMDKRQVDRKVVRSRSNENRTRSRSDQTKTEERCKKKSQFTVLESAKVSSAPVTDSPARSVAGKKQAETRFTSFKGAQKSHVKHLREFSSDRFSSERKMPIRPYTTSDRRKTKNFRTPPCSPLGTDFDTGEFFLVARPIAKFDVLRSE